MLKLWKHVQFLMGSGDKGGLDFKLYEKIFMS